MIMSNRDRHVQCHTTEDVKEALKTERLKQGLTESEFLHHLLVRTLRSLGHDVTGEVYRVIYDPERSCRHCEHPPHGKLRCQGLVTGTGSECSCGTPQVSQ